MLGLDHMPRRHASSLVSSLVRPILSDAALNAGFRRSLSISSTVASRAARNSGPARAPTTICPRPSWVLVTSKVLGNPDSVLKRSAATTAE